ncbi:hypothetical protein Glove_9g178 [Diversispora epigaea]|uniref:BTB domain-containing protein n=1 Tax=Diversispora epigaea TaxID=1348612 RepID=A0A397JSL8_9GLOM|nr:hypothetical protein Glove_9g178 [Diversispora epigaea]
MSLKFLEKLSQDFTELLDDNEEYNVIIEVGKDIDKKSFTAHSTVLRYRSSYFKNELTNTKVNENNIKIFIKPNIASQVFEIILKYIYGGIVNVENVDTKVIYELMIATKEFEFEELSKKLESHLIESKASWLRTHFSFVYHSIFKINKFKDLENFYNNIIAKYPKLIFESENFASLQELALVSILKNNDLRMEESKIWEHTIKWGISQGSNLPVKLEEWSDENFKTLKTILQDCLPLIRYFQISKTDVMDKVKPYKKILDEQLWDDLMQNLTFPDRPIKSIIFPARSISVHETLPPRENKSFSTIIKEENALEISSWIDYKSTPYSSLDMPHEFKLVLRGSRDGFDPQTFWDICHGYANTVAILKVEGTDEILGGFNPSRWNKYADNVCIKPKDSFIFSLKNGNIQDSILSRVKYPERGFCNYEQRHIYGGLSFGNEDLKMKSRVSNFSQDCFCLCSGESIHFEKPIRTTDEFFSIIDYEIFQIIKK